MARFVEALLFGLAPRDPMTLVAATLILTAVGALAGWIHARVAPIPDDVVSRLSTTSSGCFS